MLKTLLNNEDFKIKDIREYLTLVFDCDGVLLDSNKVKTDAFYKSALPYGENAANELVSYHKENGGISNVRSKYPLEVEMAFTERAVLEDTTYGVVVCAKLRERLKRQGLWNEVFERY